MKLKSLIDEILENLAESLSKNPSFSSEEKLVPGLERNWCLALKFDRRFYLSVERMQDRASILIEFDGKGER